MASTEEKVSSENNVEIRKEEIEKNLLYVRKCIEAITQRQKEVRLVAVSKYKPASDIRFAYEFGQRHFGENYVQELIEKSKMLPSDIQWHFIGTLQKIPNLWAVETIDSKKKAELMNKACVSRDDKLKIFLQVNTSGEESKSGIEPNKCLELLNYIKDNCNKLELLGLMTIGAPNRNNYNEGQPNPDFIAKEFRKERGIELELSMGMSNDFEEALKLGATSVRIGSTIFGARPVKQESGQDKV
ncbi:15379_t:CDS:2 [Funneliformis geosporum]|uniref:Pyridoxal phosphate homeostasis protein n=1 Tax=Funneliformis geosporum TaxID=1117311 RepID=A0A9W4WYG9_9GLOM|nr:15379_t:CDS:2 [Funneliformis geosporum]CAI2173017.1 3141_t:CDS:2 [Funneliformis geosporum]